MKCLGRCAGWTVEKSQKLGQKGPNCHALEPPPKGATTLLLLLFLLALGWAWLAVTQAGRNDLLHALSGNGPRRDATRPQHHRGRRIGGQGAAPVPAGALLFEECAHLLPKGLRYLQGFNRCSTPRITCSLVQCCRGFSRFTGLPTL
uniref:Uncharacterized protein n=1 Tax=Eutreptiella gymnastica TaxID=73025 RepID=A0A7S1NHH3_9EUGL